MTALRLGSLFDGIGVFPLAAVRCGIEPVWASEIEKAPISITKRHFPDMAHLGDVTKLDGREIPPVHIITFGSPCQNLSQIGNRKGLAGEKSSLFFQAIRIIREMREATNGLFPAIAVWENVMGAFSSKLFDRVARKWNVDYAFYQTEPGKYLLFFKSGQADAMTACFSEYSRKVLDKAKSRQPTIPEQMKQTEQQLAKEKPPKEHIKEVSHDR